MTTPVKYPKRPQHFAYKFFRLMAKTTLANEIGPDACFFLGVIAMTEDAKRYRGPVGFYNAQLLPIAGIGSIPALIRVRDRCVNAGWLHYTPGGNRRAATYFVTIPPDVEGVKDGPIDEGGDLFSHLDPSASSNKNGGVPLVEPESNRNRTGIEPESNRQPTIPSPSPSPSPIAAVEPPPEEEAPSPKKKRKPPAEPRPRNDLFDAVAEVTGSDPSLNGSLVGKTAAALAKAATPYTPAEVREFARRFHELCPWAAKDGRARPTVPELQKNISRLRAGKPKAPTRPTRTAADIEAEMARRDQDVRCNPDPTAAARAAVHPGDR